MTVIGIDPGSVCSSIAVLEDGEPTDKFTGKNEDVIEWLRNNHAYSTRMRWIECPVARGSIERQAVFDTVFFAGQLYAFIQWTLGECAAMSRGQVMKKLELPQKTNDAGVKAYLENIYGGDRKVWNDKRVGKNGKPLAPREETVHGLLHRWNVHERDALMVALAGVK